MNPNLVLKQAADKMRRFNPPKNNKGFTALGATTDGEYVRTPDAFGMVLRANAKELGFGGASDQTWRQISEALVPNQCPEELEDGLCLRPPAGILFYGPPGTGKTHMATIIRDMTGAHFAQVKGSELLQRWVGESEGDLAGFFIEAEEDPTTPRVLFIDELDAMAPNRGGLGSDGSGNTLRGMVSTLLTRMDGMVDPGQKRPKLLVIGATNRPEDLDPALLRDGRFSIRIEITAPDRDGRLEILEIHTREIKKHGRLANDVDLAYLADATTDFVGANLKALVDRAAMRAILEKADLIEAEWRERAASELTVGKQKRGRQASTGVFIPCPATRAKALQDAELGNAVTQISLNNVPAAEFPPNRYIYGTVDNPHRLGVPSFPTLYHMPMNIVTSTSGELFAETFAYGINTIVGHLLAADPSVLAEAIEQYQRAPADYANLIPNPARINWEKRHGAFASGQQADESEKQAAADLGKQMSKKDMPYPNVKIHQRHFLEALAFIAEREHGAPEIVRSFSNANVGVPLEISSIFDGSGFQSLVVTGPPGGRKTDMVLRAISAAPVQHYTLLGTDDFICMTDRDRARRLLSRFESALSIRAPSVVVVDANVPFFIDRERFPESWEVINLLLSRSYWERHRKPSKLFAMIIVLTSPPGEVEPEDWVRSVLPVSAAPIHVVV